MAGLQTVVPYFPIIKEGVSLATGALSNESSYKDAAKAQKQALKNLQASQQENMRQLQENAALDRAQVTAQTQEADRERQAALKRAVARQRAQYGSSGVATNDGSAEAVLLGLYNETDDERAAREKLDQIRFSSIDQNIDQQKRLNVLQRTQLQHRQSLNNLSSQANRYGSNLNNGLDALTYLSDVSDLF